MLQLPVGRPQTRPRPNSVLAHTVASVSLPTNEKTFPCLLLLKPLSKHKHRAQQKSCSGILRVWAEFSGIFRDSPEFSAFLRSSPGFSAIGSVSALLNSGPETSTGGLEHLFYLKLLSHHKHSPTQKPAFPVWACLGAKGIKKERLGVFGIVWACLG